MMAMRTMVAAGLVLALAACDGGPGDAVAPQNEVVPPEGRPQSIIRDEVRAEQDIEMDVEAPMELTVTFGDATELGEDARGAIDDFLGRERLEGDMPITLFGHSDSIGSDEANERASRTRAQSVATYLVDKGVDPDRITIVPMGEHNPVRPNLKLDGSEDEAGQRANRRVEIAIGTPAEIATRRNAKTAERAAAEEDAGLEAETDARVPAASTATSGAAQD